MNFLKDIQPAVASALSFNPKDGFAVSDLEPVYKVLKTDPVSPDSLLFAELGCEMIPMVRELIKLAADIMTDHLDMDVPRDVYTRYGINHTVEGWMQRVFFTFTVAHDPENFKLMMDAVSEGTTIAQRVAALRELTLTGYNKTMADLKTLL